MSISYRIKHVGINHSDDAAAQKSAEQLMHLFDLPRGLEDQDKVFVGDLFEVMKHERIGRMGHIALQTEDVEAAMADLAAKGVAFRETTIRRNGEGKIIFVYLDLEIGGFSFHLTI